jgi:glycosyltransferase involved in cell wall biosynthesis
MKISVVIPAHNASGFVGRAVESALTQTFQAHEVIVVNDRSSDRTSDIVRDTFPDVSLYEVSYGNAAAARNAGIKRATGDSIAFLDSDDVWHPHHLAEAKSHLLGTNHAAYMAFADYVLPSGERREIKPFSEQSLHGLTGEDFVDMFRRFGWFCNCTVVVRRERAWEVGGFDESLIRRHDFEFFMRVIHDRSWCFSARPGALIHLAVPGSISSKELECRLFSVRALRKRTNDYQTSCFDRLLRSHAEAAVNLAMRLYPDRVAEVLREFGDLIGPFRAWIYWSASRVPPLRHVLFGGDMQK